jgi:SAM-dependent methyltransferase
MATENPGDDMTREAHWNSPYEDKGTTGVSWYQSTPTMSLAIIESLMVPKDAGTIDIGGGASPLAASLLDRGFIDLTVLDVSERALELSQGHLGAHAGEVTWLHEDLLTWTPSRTYDVWHDRAVFHFLVDPANQQRYVETLLAGLAPDGAAIFGTFAPDGPPQCSGLPVAHFDAATLGAVLGSSFVLLDERREEHHTPTGAMQPFTWTTFRRQ